MKTSKHITRFWMLLIAAAVMLLPAAQAGALVLKVRPEQEYVPLGGPTEMLLHIVVEGEEMRIVPGERMPLNVCFVLDKSGSMRKDHKWESVCEALRFAVRQIGPNDYVSLVIYDSAARLVIPPRRGIDPRSIDAYLEELSPGGSTALYEGTELGLRAVGEHRDYEFVNRVILLSDGLANVGPSSPRALAELAARYHRRGIQISTIGVGCDYNEDLMQAMAEESGGNYHYLRHGSQIVSVFEEELEGLMQMVAKDVDVIIELPRGIRLIEALDKEITVEGERLRVRFDDLYSKQKRNITLRVRIDPSEMEGNMNEGKHVNLASVKVDYRSTAEKMEPRRENLTARIRVTSSSDKIRKSINKDVKVRGELLRSAGVQEKAAEMAERGKRNEAIKLLEENHQRLRIQAEAFGEPALSDRAEAISNNAVQYETEDRFAKKQSKGEASDIMK